MKTLADFALDADQQMIRESAEAFLAENCSSEAVRRAMESELGYDPALWRRIGAELGWCATAIPERHGGLGLSWIELTLLMERMGQRLLCSPYLATVCLAASALLEAGGEAGQARYLPAIADGGLTATLALADRGVEWKPEALSCRATARDGGFVLDGAFRHVPDGAHAQLLLVPAWLDGELALFALDGDTAGVRRREHANIDRTRRVAEIRVEGAAVPADALLARGPAVAVGLARAAALAAIALAAEQLGGAQQCLDLTLTYTAERVQFGRTVNSFQAVKHRCAEMMVRIEAARSAVYGAARVASAGADTGALLLEAACVKAFASEAFYFCAQEAIQLHGGVGFTWEYDPQLYFKRAQAGSQWLGSIDGMRERAAAALLDHGADHGARNMEEQHA
ncbi:acyl-CoA dehydrogenase family protein [Pseudoduganella namucuonensis]|uniref:Acyl-CoA dehydrogenase n=1 Tax=Pseudoduganella namucuonensis TaxID=1035707 RepID=A0A1I7LSF1_9BURK|nr:acyl-CoA dehydrogenase family protein [Pseudoduganella namucuonensis]SFV12603.1 Acyl-CoA dehydrogenase [Pseudoduganella namucuonensis]